jgi:hypothetical protein
MGAEKAPAGAPGRWQPRCAGGCHCQSGPARAGGSLPVRPVTAAMLGPARASPSLRLGPGPAPARFLRFKVQTQTALGRWVPPQAKNQNRRGGACRGQCDWQPLPARRSGQCGGRPRTRRPGLRRTAVGLRRSHGRGPSPCAPVPSHGVAASVGLWPLPPEQITCTVQCHCH